MRSLLRGMQDIKAMDSLNDDEILVIHFFLHLLNNKKRHHDGVMI